MEEDDSYAVAKEHLFQNVLFATDFLSNADHAFNFISQPQRATIRATLLDVHGHEQTVADETTARDRLVELAADLERRMVLEVGTTVRTGVGSSSGASRNRSSQGDRTT